MMQFTPRVHFLVCFSGIFFGYLVYGILQETITKSKYEYKGEAEKFTYTQALVITMCLVNSLVAKLMMKLLSHDADPTSNTSYAACSFSYVGAMLASNKALQFVPYPTQVLGKSIKPIPVMLMGVLLIRKKYSATKYLCVLLIVSGVALFMYKPQTAAGGHSGSVIGVGELLLLTSLTLDGVTGVLQDKIRQSHKISPYCMMLNVNVWSCLWLAIGLVLSGELFSFLAFMQRYPYILGNLLAAGAASAVGQIFIFQTITHFGPLACSIITTTRKFFTILASVIIFQNPMSSRQWFAAVLVFAGLALDSYFSKKAKNEADKQKANGVEGDEIKGKLT